MENNVFSLSVYQRCDLFYGLNGPDFIVYIHHRYKNRIGTDGLLQFL